VLSTHSFNSLNFSAISSSRYVKAGIYTFFLLFRSGIQFHFSSYKLSLTFATHKRALKAIHDTIYTQEKNISDLSEQMQI
jgi:hypothetical protein